MEILFIIAKYGTIIAGIFYLFAILIFIYLIGHAYKGVEHYERRKYNILLVTDAILFSIATMILSSLYI